MSYSGVSHIMMLFFMCSLTSIKATHGVIEMSVTEGDSVMLPCSVTTNIKDTLFDWRMTGKNGAKKEVFMYNKGQHYNNGLEGQDEQYKNQVSFFEEELEHGNASIVIRDTTIYDNGTYECILPYLSAETLKQTVELLVRMNLKNRLEQNPDAVQPPYTKLLRVTDGGVVLQCVVRGAFPQPTVKWQTCEGDHLSAEEPLVSERKGRYDITLLATVTKTQSNCFRCVVIQDDIGHIIDDELTLPEKLFENETCYGTAVLACACLFGILFFADAAFILIKWIRKRKSKESRNMMGTQLQGDAEDNEDSRPAGVGDTGFIMVTKDETSCNGSRHVEGDKFLDQNDNSGSDHRASGPLSNGNGIY